MLIIFFISTFILGLMYINERHQREWWQNNSKFWRDSCEDWQRHYFEGRIVEKQTGV